MAAAMMNVFPMFFLLFSGFFVLPDEIPKPWIWAYYISYCSYGLQGLSINEYEDNYSYVNSNTGDTIPPGKAYT